MGLDLLKPKGFSKQIAIVALRTLLGAIPLIPRLHQDLHTKAPPDLLKVYAAEEGFPG